MRAVLVCCLCCLSMPLFADTVELRSGEKLQNVETTTKPGGIEVRLNGKTQFLPWEKVRKVTRSQPAPTPDQSRETVAQESQKADEVKPLPHQQQQRPAAIYLSTDPAGADVYIDGQIVGKTPYVGAANGTLQNFKIHRAGFRDIEIPIRSADQIELFFALESWDAAECGLSGPPYWSAGLRSFFLPGWGQHAKGERSAFVFATAGIGLMGLSGYLWRDYQARQKAYRDVIARDDVFLGVAAVATNQGSALNFAVADFITKGRLFHKDSVSSRRWTASHTYAVRASYLLAAFQFYSVGDAIFSTPERDVSVSIVPGAAQDNALAAAIQVRF